MIFARRVLEFCFISKFDDPGPRLIENPFKKMDVIHVFGRRTIRCLLIQRGAAAHTVDQALACVCDLCALLASGVDVGGEEPCLSLGLALNLPDLLAAS